MIERKSYPISEFKSDDQTGIIEAVVSVFSNVDSGNEKVMPGFFTKSIERKLPKGVWAHDWKQPIAKTLEAKELLPGDPLLPDSLKMLGGAYIKGQFNMETQRGKEAYSDIKMGIVDEFSIGYKVIKDKKSENGTRELIEGDWKEWSPVLVGMNDSTALISIKSENGETKGLLEDCIEECEESLYFLADKYQMACYRVQMLMEADPSFDAAGAIQTICDELATRTIAALTGAEEQTDSMDEMADTSISFKGDLRGRLPFAKHAETALGAVEAFAKRGAAVIEIVTELSDRCKAIQELRTKAGAVYSGSNLSHMTRIREAMGKVKKDMAAVHSDMGVLISRANKEKTDEELDTQALRTQTLRAQTIALQVLN